MEREGAVDRDEPEDLPARNSIGLRDKGTVACGSHRFCPEVSRNRRAVNAAPKNLSSMYRSLLFAATCGFVAQATAQSYVHQVFVLNEGYFNMNTQTQEVPVSLGSYDPATGIYQTVATIAGQRFASDVDLANSAVYVAADGALLKYDADTYTLLDQAPVPGIRKIALWNDQVLITRGELGGLAHYFEVREMATLDLLYSIDPTDGLLYSAEDVEVVGDKAYLAVGNAFDFGNMVGLLGIVDLPSGTYVNEVDLGPNGINPENIMVAGQDLYVLCNKDFSGSSISKVTTAGAFAFTEDITENSGCGASELVADKVVYNEYALSRMARYDITTENILDTLATTLFPYSLLNDPLNNVMYATTTDFVSTGTLHVLEHDGTELSSTAIGVSAGRLCLDVRTSTATSEHAQQSALSVFPVPASDRVTVSMPLRSVGPVRVLDAAGREVLNITAVSNTVQLDLSAFEPGVYSVQVPGLPAARIVKY